MLTPNQTKDLLDIIEQNNILFVSSKLGPNYLNSDEISKLKSIGIDPYKYYNESNDIVKLSLHFGLISDAIGEKQSKLASFEDLKKYFSSGKYIPLTQKEKFALDSVKKQYLGDITANKNRIFNDINNVISTHQKNNRKAYEAFLEGEIKAGMFEKKTTDEIAREIARKTGDWSRNFKRIVDFISHSAYDEGRALAIEKDYGDDALVWKRVYNGACKKCVELYQKNGIPKIFKLSALRNNGTNIGRKQTDWLPVVGSTHPHCRCTLHHYDQQFEWNKETKNWDIPKENVQESPKKERPKVAISFMNKEYKV